MEYPHLTEEQNKQLKKLTTSTRLRAAWICIKNMFILVAMTFLAAFLNVAYVNSHIFTGIMGILNGFMIIKLFRKDLQCERNRIANEVLKILQQ